LLIRAGIGHNSGEYEILIDERVVHRKRGVIPNCIPPAKHVSIVEQMNINAAITDYAEKYAEWTRLYILGPHEGGIDYDTWWRLSWNYNLLKPMR
jgi:hypothetical protein